jgi:hypothetical protein
MVKHASVPAVVLSTYTTPVVRCVGEPRRCAPTVHACARNKEQEHKAQGQTQEKAQEKTHDTRTMEGWHGRHR